MNWQVKIEEDPYTKELTLPIPTDLLNQMGWDIGDDLVWEESMPGTSYTLKKVDKPGEKKV